MDEVRCDRHPSVPNPKDFLIMALTRATLHLMLLDSANDRTSSGTAATRPGPVSPFVWLAADEDDDDDDIDDDDDNLDDEDDEEVAEDGDDDEVADDDEDDFDDDDEDDEEADDDVNAGAGRQNPDRVH